MKKTILNLAVATALMAGTITAHSQSAEQKVEAAKDKEQNAKQELKDAKTELNAEYPAFKKAAEEKIASNEKRIKELRKEPETPGNASANLLRKQKIDALEKRNADLKSRLYAYEKERSGWEAFKGGFNRDMDNLRDAFKDFGKDLKK